MQYEAWYHGLSGDSLQGAAYWAANRSMPQRILCASASGMSAAWVGGCEAAAQRLAVADHLRLSSPDYRRGWNSIPSDPIDSNPGTAPAATTPTQTPAAVTPGPLDQTPTPPTGNAASPFPATPDASQSNFNTAGAGLALVGLAIVLGALAVYFLPTLIAAGRKKRNTLAIFALNLLLGWTFLGWVAALVWSLSVDVQPASP